MKKVLFLFLLFIIFQSLHAQQTVRQYISGTDKDHTVQWGFFCTKGNNSGKWTKIAVPSNWELQGFGQYTYGHDKDKINEQGLYKTSFTVPASWQNKIVKIIFEGAMTDVEVKVNGKSCGPVHQGGFYEFSYDITSLVKFGATNKLDVTVSKASSNASIEKAERGGDFWAFGGIYRPVYLEALPQTHIERTAINATADGNLEATIFHNNTKPGDVIQAKVQTLNGTVVGKSFTVSLAGNESILTQSFDHILLWNPEQPNLYQITFNLIRNNSIIHSVNQRFGFRTAVLKPHDGFYLNGTKVVFKGVDRHSEWPASGRTLSRDIHLMDIGLIKDMNMNAVRMSHYPPDRQFLDLCDSLGLMVLDELTGWQAAYDTVSGKRLVKELVTRDVNHPSIVIWDNGNEGGWNRALDNDYALYDPQKRLVIHPWEKFNGTDTKHYPDYKYIVNESLYGNDVFFPTEYMHGLYDGGHAAGLEDFWERMRTYHANAGGFLWAFHDEGVVRTDMNGMIDCHGNHAPDGIIGPYREKEASYYAIKQIWSPVYISTKTLSVDFDGNLLVENRYHFTNLSDCKLKWKLANFSSSKGNESMTNWVDSGFINMPSILPGEKRSIPLPVLSSLPKSQALYVTAIAKDGKEISTWSWPLQTAIQVNKKLVTNTLNTATEIKNHDKLLQIVSNNITYTFDTTSGYLQKVTNASGKEISLSGGPSAGPDQVKQSFDLTKNQDTVILEISYSGNGWSKMSWTFAPGKLPKLSYKYAPKGERDFMGITFNYPEEKITGMKWLGRGPYRVWKNRLQGMQFGVWQKAYNNTVTGENWNYPEFKGYHANVYWTTIQTKESDFTIYTNNDNVFLQMLVPQKPKTMTNDNVTPAFPNASLGFMSAIPAIGTKFQQATSMGPESQKNMLLNNKPVEGELWFAF
ncbi:glycoside hydrolase family 2 TIM barrel-domain containing protein [Danxiaibacter flavus]|uniref:beta-galactosidase n=1 Tax=Danxiaibacter flavus TaxID=3049108 RepID=A0ABV3ZFH9_9BACT|nr:glycoside hydrolase family 2 TIM barrel-domain containing protein [Chitinophagaceae bacterium DXS]